MEVYLDNSATTRPYAEVCSAMFDTMSNNYGNPSSLHKLGIEAERAVKTAKERVAAAIKADPSEILFTSGGTESDNLALLGAAAANRGRHILTTPLEHPAIMSVLPVLRDKGYRVEFIPVDSDGRVMLERFEKMIKPDTFLVSAMLVNNEIGTLEPIAEMAEILKKKRPGALMHTDAVQGFGKVPINVNSMRVDMISISSHKIHGPKGMGALYVRRGTKLRPIIYGGGQQTNLRSGTENVPGIVGFGVAAKMAAQDLEKKAERVAALRKRLEAGLLRLDDIKINTPNCCAPHILNVSFGGVKSEVLLHSLELSDIYVSSGSACSSHKKEPSYVLTEIGVKPRMIDGSIRFSLSEFTTAGQIDEVIQAVEKTVPRLRRLNMR